MAFKDTGEESSEDEDERRGRRGRGGKGGKGGLQDYSDSDGDGGGDSSDEGRGRGRGGGNMNSNNRISHGNFSGKKEMLWQRASGGGGTGQQNSNSLPGKEEGNSSEDEEEEEEESSSEGDGEGEGEGEGGDNDEESEVENGNNIDMNMEKVDEEEEAPSEDDEDEEMRRPAFGGLGLGKKKTPTNQQQATPANANANATATTTTPSSSYGQMKFHQAKPQLGGGGIGKNNQQQQPQKLPQQQQQQQASSYGQRQFPQQQQQSPAYGQKHLSQQTHPQQPKSKQAQQQQPQQSRPNLPPQKLSKDFGSFEKWSGGLGSKMMAAMGSKGVEGGGKGYVRGEALGKEPGRGIVEPIDVKLRPTGVGLGMIDERTEAVKREKERTSTKKKKDLQQEGGKDPSLPPPPNDRWKKQGIKQRKPTYKVARDLLKEDEERGGNIRVPLVSVAPIATKVRDLRGEVEHTYTDISQLSKQEQPSHGMMNSRFPELVYNIQMIGDQAKGDLLHLSRQMRMEEQGRRLRLQELMELEETLVREGKRGVMLEGLKGLSEDFVKVGNIHLNELTGNGGKEEEGEGGGDKVHELVQGIFGPLLERFGRDFPRLPKTALKNGKENDDGVVDWWRDFNLSHLMVSVILTPVTKGRIKAWRPLQRPLYMGNLFRWWSLYLGEEGGDINEGGGGGVMSAFEALLYYSWLPKIRQTVNNEWNPTDPDKLIDLLEFYTSGRRPILPRWMITNIITQLILPKLERKLDSWNFREDLQVHLWLFCWLPVIGDDGLKSIFSNVRRKFQLRLRDWSPNHQDVNVLDLFKVWRQVWQEGDDSMVFITSTILPKLIQYLRTSFEINPASQDLQPLIQVLEWAPFIPQNLFSHLLATEFFPAWLQCLWSWIHSPQASLDEISAWYVAWKSFFTEGNGDTGGWGKEVGRLEAVKEGFRAGLDLMNQGITTSMNGGTQSSFQVDVDMETRESHALAAAKQAASFINAEGGEFTFKEYVGQLAAEASLEFIPLGKRHEKSGKELYRLGTTLSAYIEEGVLFCSMRKGPTAGQYRFMSVEDAIELASGV